MQLKSELLKFCWASDWDHPHTCSVHMEKQEQI